MTSPIERSLLRNPLFDTRVVTDDITSFLPDLEWASLEMLASPQLNRANNNQRPKELYQKFSDRIIQKIDSPDTASATLRFAAHSRNFYMLNVLLSYPLQFQPEYGVNRAFTDCAATGNLTGMGMILESRKKGDYLDLSKGLVEAADKGHVEVIRRLLEPDLIAFSIEGAYEAIKNAPASKNWRIIFELLIEKIPESERAEVLTKVAEVASSVGNIPCLRYLFQKNLIQNWDSAVLAACGDSLDFFLDPNLAIPLSRQQILECLKDTRHNSPVSDVELEIIRKKLLSSPKVAALLNLESLFCDNALYLRIEYLNRNIDKFSWDIDLRDPFSGQGLKRLFYDALFSHSFKILKAFTDRPHILNKLYKIYEEDPTLVYLIGTKELQKGADLCKDSHRHELARQFEAIISERNKCLRRVSHLFHAKIWPRIHYAEPRNVNLD